jgi:hypothetical protein
LDHNILTLIFSLLFLIRLGGFILPPYIRRMQFVTTFSMDLNSNGFTGGSTGWLDVY